MERSPAKLFLWLNVDFNGSADLLCLVVSLSSISLTSAAMEHIDCFLKSADESLNESKLSLSERSSISVFLEGVLLTLAGA